MAAEPSPVVLVDTADGVCTVTLNRPDKRNALNTPLTRALVEALAAAEADGEVRAVVLAGTGRGFCAGADLEEAKTLSPSDQAAVLARADLSLGLYTQPRRMTKPVVAAVHGAAVGGGAGLALGADMVVAAADLQFGFPELRHSMVPALVMTALQRAMGRKAAFEMISLGRLVGAEEAKALGLVNRVAATPEAAFAEALEIARAWAKVKPAAMAATKALFYRVADLAEPAAMQAGRDTNALMRGFQDR